MGQNQSFNELAIGGITVVFHFVAPLVPNISGLSSILINKMDGAKTSWFLLKKEKLHCTTALKLLSSLGNWAVTIRLLKKKRKRATKHKLSWNLL